MNSTYLSNDVKKIVNDNMPKTIRFSQQEVVNLVWGSNKRLYCTWDQYKYLTSKPEGALAITMAWGEPKVKNISVQMSLGPFSWEREKEILWQDTEALYLEDDLKVTYTAHVEEEKNRVVYRPVLHGTSIEDPWGTYQMSEEFHKTVVEALGLETIMVEFPEPLVTMPVPEYLVAETDWDSFRPPAILTPLCLQSEARAFGQKAWNQLIDAGVIQV